MSGRELCLHCLKGRRRPFQLSASEAIIKCDNIDCDGFLDDLPWNCIIPKVAYIPSEVPNGGLPCVSNSSGRIPSNNSGSSAVSPAVSQTSLTDREVELLLRRSYAPAYGSSKLKQTQLLEANSFKPHGSDLQVTGDCDFIGSSSDPASTASVESKDSENSVGENSEFFNLLNSLDLDTLLGKATTNLRSISKKSLSKIGSSDCSDIESWLDSYETPLIGNQDVRSKFLTSGDGSTTAVSSNTHSSSVLIPSNRSAFSQVPQRIEHRQTLNSAHSAFNGMDQQLQEYFGSSSKGKLAGGKDDVSSVCDSQFLSPAGSAVSEDSGFNDDEVGRITTVTVLSKCGEGLSEKSKASAKREAAADELQASQKHNSSRELTFSAPCTLLELKGIINEGKGTQVFADKTKELASDPHTAFGECQPTAEYKIGKCQESEQRRVQSGTSLNPNNTDMQDNMYESFHSNCLQTEDSLHNSSSVVGMDHTTEAGSSQSCIASFPADQGEPLEVCSGISSDNEGYNCRNQSLALCDTGDIGELSSGSVQTAGCGNSVTSDSNCGEVTEKVSGNTFCENKTNHSDVKDYNNCDMLETSESCITRCSSEVLSNSRKVVGKEKKTQKRQKSFLPVRKSVRHKIAIETKAPAKYEIDKWDQNSESIYDCSKSQQGQNVKLGLSSLQSIPAWEIGHGIAGNFSTVSQNRSNQQPFRRLLTSGLRDALNSVCCTCTNVFIQLDV